MGGGVLRSLLTIVLAVTGGIAASASVVIHEAPSRFGGSVVVTDDGDRLRSLRFGRNGDAQTTIRVGDPDYLHLHYARIVMAGIALVDNPRRTLLVGLGGGSIAVFLRKYFPRMTIDVVEIDPAVVAVAKSHFGFREDKLMRAFVADARTYIDNSSQAAYDMIILDAYGSDATPVHLTTLQFLQAVRKITAPGGIVISSFWTRPKNPKYDAMVRTYQEAFGGIRLVEAPEKANVVLFALPRADPMDRAAFAAAARRVSMSNRFRFDLGVLVERGHLEIPPKGGQATILIDAAKARTR
jgi:spermidine synthase